MLKGKAKKVCTGKRGIPEIKAAIERLKAATQSLKYTRLYGAKYGQKYELFIIY